MDFGNVVKRTNDDFVINADLTVYGSGYNVVPKTVDPYNAYEIEDVRGYCEQHPDKVFDDYNLQPEPSWEDKIEAQVTYTAMMTDTLLEAEE